MTFFQDKFDIPKINNRKEVGFKNKCGISISTLLF